VYLPVIKKASNNGMSTTSEPIQGGKERILLVDDEGPIIKLEKKCLGN